MLAKKTIFGFGHGCLGNRIVYSLTDALGIVCSWKWTWMFCRGSYALDHGQHKDFLMAG